MANQAESQGAELKGPHGERTRMKAGYGRESVGRPDETGIRHGGSDESNQQPVMDAGQGPPSRQTSTAKDMSGQV